MHKKIGRHFIAFNMMIISLTSAILILLLYLGSRTTLSWQRLLLSLTVMLALVFVSSVILNKFAAKPIKAAWQKQLDFTADASHELRTPLAVIRTNLELVMESPTETVAAQMKWLKNIEAENLRMAALVDGLLTLSRADADKTELHKKPFILDDVVTEAVTAFLPFAESKGIRCVIQEACQIELTADKHRIKQLIMILLDNAIKYTPDGGNITLSFSKENDSVKISVSDTGVGIAAADIPKIFDRFFRAENARGINQEGSGLGLSVAKWIVSEHGGTISVNSILGEESCFVIKLPCS